MPIVTLDALRAHLGIPAAEASEDPRLWAALEAASSEAERRANRRFLPVQAARLYPAQGRACLPLAGDLLELISVTDGAGGLVAGLVAAPQTAPHDHLLRGDQSLFIEGPYTVTGIWGWLDSGEGTGWQATGQTLTALLDADDAQADVADAAALAAGGGTLFQVGALLRLADEFVWVRAVDAALNRLTITRAAQGTSAAAHAAGTAVLRWQTAPLVSGWVLRRAAALYREPDGIPLPAAEADVLRVVRRLTVGL